MPLGSKRQNAKAHRLAPSAGRREVAGYETRVHAQVCFDSVGTYVSPYREPSSDLGRSYFLFFTPARTSDLLYTESTFPRWPGSADHRQ